MSSDAATLFAKHAAALLASARTDAQRTLWTRALRGLRRQGIDTLAKLAARKSAWTAEDDALRLRPSPS